MGKFGLEELGNLSKERRKLEERERQIKSQCTHTGGRNEKLKIIPLADDRVRCKLCGAEFSVRPVSRSDQDKAVSVITDMLNQVRAFGDTNDSNDSKTVNFLGQLMYEVSRIPENYEKVLDGYIHGKKKKNDKQYQPESKGSYGMPKRW